MNSHIILLKIYQKCLIDDNNCWNWTKAIDKDGYGKTSYQNKSWRVSKLVFTLLNSIITNDLLILHTCDNSKCCNPNHLKLGTYTENNIETVLRDRRNNKTNLDLTWQIRKLDTLEQRLAFYLQKTKQTNIGCLESTVLETTKDGYYQVTYNGKSYRLHRLLLSRKLNCTYNELDQARHICRNNSCINVDHIENGTRQQNSIDSREFSKATKLSNTQVKDLKLDRINWDFTIRGNKAKFDKSWAEKLKVSPITIRFIRTEKRWTDV